MNSDLETFVPIDYKWRGVQRLAQTATPAHDTKFLVGMGRAFYWQSLLATGAMASGSAIARAEGLAPSTVNELRRLFSILLSLAARTLGWLCRAQRLSHSVSTTARAQWVGSGLRAQGVSLPLTAQTKTPQSLAKLRC